jgi:pyrroline-5-carboxylate reductase
MLNDKKIAIIGTGNMGGALIDGLVVSGSSSPENIICTDIRENTLNDINAKYGIRTTTDNKKACEVSDVIVLATKPQILASVLKEIAPYLNMEKVIISIAAGVPMVAIESCLNKKLRLVRAMPNIAVAVKQGATAIAAGPNAHPDDIQLAKAIFDSVGESVFIEENILMDAITGLSGSGPAYIFLIVDALADAGVKMGLARNDAQVLATQTVLGAAEMLRQTKEHPGQLKDKVTSPGGTAIAGIHTLEKGGLRTTLINAVEVATNRSKELGEVMIKNFQEG